jgi:ankyrin repeat protein
MRVLHFVQFVCKSVFSVIINTQNAMSVAIPSVASLARSLTLEKILYAAEVGLNMTELLRAYVEQLKVNVHIVEAPDELCVKEMIDRGAVVDAKLLRLSMDKHSSLLSLLIEYGHGDVTAVNQSGQTLLMIAAAENSLIIAEILVLAGADVNASDNEGFTAAHYALNFRMIMFIVESGGDINAESHGGVTVLMQALRNKNSKKAIDFLLSHGADIYTRDYNGYSVLDYVDRYAPELAVEPWVLKLRHEESRWNLQKEWVESVMHSSKLGR